MIKKYIEITIKVNREYEEELIYRLHEIEDLGIEIIDSEDVKYLIENLHDDEITSLEYIKSDEIYLKAYLNMDEEDKIRKIKELKKDIPFTFEINTVENDWSKEWMKFYEPMEVGENIVIIPQWMDEKTNRIKIYINPGMAFGTGSHETTQLVMEEIEKHLVKNKACLDIGCGSGILSILLSKLEASTIVACDISDDALNATKENVENNKVSNISIRKSNLFSNVEGKFDIICGNLIAEIIVDMLDEVDYYLNDGGILILSGILDEKENLVLEKIKDKYKIINRRKNNEWVMLALEKEDNV